MTSEEADRETLAVRARELARPRSEHQAQQIEKYALFERAGVRYAIESRFVFAVSHMLTPTPLPGAAPYWAGVSSVHGELLALVDLGVLLANGSDQAPIHGDAELDDEARTHLVLVLGTDKRELGLLIDAVLDTQSLSLDIARAASGDAAAQLMVGTTRDGTQLVRGDALLADPRLYIQENHFTES
jgi:chemotaxis signal transduction protein